MYEQKHRTKQLKQKYTEKKNNKNNNDEKQTNKTSGQNNTKSKLNLPLLSGNFLDNESTFTKLETKRQRTKNKQTKKRERLQC